MNPNTETKRRNGRVDEPVRWTQPDLGLYNKVGGSDTVASVERPAAPQALSDARSTQRLSTMQAIGDPARWPEPLPQVVGLPLLTMEQLQTLAQMAQAMQAINSQPSITSLTEPGMMILPGQLQVIGITDLEALVIEFLENKIACGRKKGTLANYTRSLGRLMQVCPKLPVTPAHVREAITKPTWKQSTRFLMFTHIKAFFNELELMYGCPNPCRMIGRVDRGESKRQILSLKQMEAVYHAATVTTKRPQYHRFTPRNKAIALLMIECGPRVSEIANIRTWDVGDGWVTLDGKTGQRTVPLCRELTDRMKDLATGNVVWQNYHGNAMSHRDVDYLVSGLLEKAGITGPILGVHLMRHSFATNYLRNGGGVFHLQDIMGHRSIVTTRHYVRLAAVDAKMDHSRTSLTKALDLLRE